MAASMIEIEYLKQLLDIFDASSVHDLRIEQEGVEIKLSKSPRRDEQAHVVQYAAAPLPAAAPAATPAPATPATPAEPPAATAASQTGAKIHEIRSPIVGTFYRAPNPDSPNFVEVGSRVSPGMVLCIVEAMKLMNELECDVYGVIASIAVESGQPVEYNQLLFTVQLD